MTHRSRLRFVIEGMEGSVVLAAVLVTWPVSKRWLRDWGARRAECEHAWPGDKYVSADQEAYTRAIDIAAPAETVWRWIVQFGLDRAGFYSYELLEHLGGIPVTNVESIEPALQELAVGDEVRLHPKAPGIPVAEVEPGRYVCFGVRPDAPPAADRPGAGRSWSIYVEPAGGRSCRLVLRTCIKPLREPSWPERLEAALETPVDFVMEQRMLRTIKRLAERPRRAPRRPGGHAGVA